jgi:large subunit ribosomal protein L22
MSQVVYTKSSAKGILQTPRKIGLVAALVRGRSVEDALVILGHTPKRAALPLKKAIESAKANAVNNHKIQEKDLQISELRVGEGRHLKRYRAGARGMAKPYEKRTSHIFITLSGNPKPAKKLAAKKTTKKEEEK